MLKKISLGLLLLILLPLAFFLLKPNPEPVLSKQPPRLLVLLLDGIPEFMVREAQNDGLFNYFYPTARMIGTFPSITNPSFGKMFTDSPLPGFVRGYFDIAENQKHEKYGALTGVVGPMNWEGIMNYSNHAIVHKLTAFVAPLYSTIKEIDGLEDAFFASHASIFYGYLVGTDAAAHMTGRKGVRLLLEILDYRLRRLMTRYEALTGEPLMVILLADHGNNLVPLKFVDWEKNFGPQGFHSDEKITDDKSIVKVIEGFSTATALYTSGKHDAELAAILAKDKAVNVVAYKEGQRVFIVNQRGRAILSRQKPAPTKSGVSYRYQILEGDPLGYKTILERLSSEERISADGFVDDRVLFYSTQSHAYPDALHRLYDGFFETVTNQPNLLVSLVDGYTTADQTLLRTLETFSGIYAHVEGSHGGLLASHSNGPFMSNFIHTLDIRPEDFRQYLDLSYFGIRTKEPPLIDWMAEQQVLTPSSAPHGETQAWENKWALAKALLAGHFQEAYTQWQSGLARNDLVTELRKIPATLKTRPPSEALEDSGEFWSLPLPPLQIE